MTVRSVLLSVVLVIAVAMQSSLSAQTASPASPSDDKELASPKPAAPTRGLAVESEPSTLVELKYHSPSEVEVQRYRDAMSNLDLEADLVDRFALRCDGFIFDDRQPESFVFLHAVDRELDADRHIVIRRFTDDQDPRLSVSIEGADGYGDTRIDGETFFPSVHDRLRIADKYYLEPDVNKGIDRKTLRISSEDRNLNPVTASVLPYSSFFYGRVSKMRISGIYPVATLQPDGVTGSRSNWTVRHDLRLNGKPTAKKMYIQFRDTLPVNVELWHVAGEARQMLYRTMTKWAEFGEVRLPVRLEAVELRGPSQSALAFEADFQWKFNDDVPDRLFKVSDVASPTALHWE